MVEKKVDSEFLYTNLILQILRGTNLSIEDRELNY